MYPKDTNKQRPLTQAFHFRSDFAVQLWTLPSLDRQNIMCGHAVQLWTLPSLDRQNIMCGHAVQLRTLPSLDRQKIMCGHAVQLRTLPSLDRQNIMCGRATISFYYTITIFICQKNQLSFETTIGLRHGDLLSTLSFNLCMEKTIINVRINPGGTLFNITRHMRMMW